MSKVLPILFNTEMVQAILDGRKIVTRRVVKPQPTYSPNEGFSWKGAAFGTDLPPTEKGAARNLCCSAPYQPGDILYVRERFCKGEICCGEEPDGREVLYVSQCEGEDDFIHYEYCVRNYIGIENVAWKPSIHMPKEAARIWLKVSSVRMERLQNAWASDVSKEGLKFYRPYTADEMLLEFAKLWDSTINKTDIDKYGWYTNPYVWVIEFERCNKPEF